MNSKVTYHQQVSYCGKPRCRKCREGTGHGPYWYAYQTIDGRTTRTYVGKQLPPEAQAMMEGLQGPPTIQSAELEQALVRIYVLGQFRLERRVGRSTEWQTVTDSAWQHQRVRALLGCLVSSTGRKLGREQIMDALWPDLDVETAASRLDRAVYSLRQLFEPSRSRLATSPLLLTEREVVVLAEQSQIWIDADAFEHILAQARASNDPGEKERLLEDAATLYGGNFLPEERRIEWTLARRDSLQRSWIGLLLELADLRIAREALNSAIDPLDRLLSIDPTNEAAVQRLIVLLAQLGRRGEALRTYKRLSSVLQQEYHIAPLPETRALYDAVRSGNAQPTSTHFIAPAQSGTTGDRVAARDGNSSAPRPDLSAAIQIGRSHQSLLVGREEELSLLRNLVTTTEQATRFKMPGQKRASAISFDTQRRPQCMLLMGDVGIGKTRLAEEVSRDATKRGWAVAWSRVYAQEGSIPYRLWTEVMRTAMARGAWQRQEVSKRPLVFQPLSALLPELQDFLPQIAYPSQLSPEQEQLRLWEASRELLTLISGGTPLLIALDDLQWADSSSCELLAYLARRVYGFPIVIVGTCRDNELPASHPLRSLLTDLQREHAVETLSLQPLSDEQIAALVSQMPLPELLVQRIRDRAAGNPYFAEELARTVGGDGSSFDAPLDGHADGENILPDTISAVLDLRLDRLSAPCQRLLSKAAVLGSSFSFYVINEMEASTPGSDEDMVLELLEEGLRSGMLTEEGTGTRITYHFWHPLLVSHLYERLSAARRASLHRRAADILRRVYQNREEEGAATITRHLVRGGADPELVARYAELAGNHAYSLSSYAEAEEFYRIALENMDLNQWRASPDADEHRAYLLEILGECMRSQGKFDEARGFYEQTLKIRNRPHGSILSTDRQQETEIQALLWCEVGWTWHSIGDNAQARQCYQHAEQVLRDADLVTGLAWASLRYQQSYISWQEGSYEEARKTANEALNLFETLALQNPPSVHASRSTQIRRTLAGDPVDLGRTHSLLGTIEASGGRCGDALPHFDMALNLYEQHDSQREIAIVCCEMGDVHLRQAEYTQAQAILRRSLNIAERVGETHLASFVVGNLGVLAVRTGNLPEAEAKFRRGIALAERVNDSASVGAWHTYLAVVLLEQGKLSEAKSALCRALSISRALHIGPYIGLALVAAGNVRVAQVTEAGGNDKKDKYLYVETSRALKKARATLRMALALEGMEAETRTEGQLTLAQVLLLLGEVDAAGQLAEQTLEEARRFELTWLVARAQRVLGAIATAQGQPEQAARYFEQAIETFRKCGMRLECARALQHYGEALVQRDDASGKACQRGLLYLQEARQIFADCKAALDLQVAERTLARYGRTPA